MGKTLVSLERKSGGTGKFLGIRGIVRAETSADPVSGTNENKSEIKYWMEN